MLGFRLASQKLMLDFMYINRIMNDMNYYHSLLREYGHTVGMLQWFSTIN